MIRRPPRSTRTDTLFPYTTLFRSRLREIALLGNLPEDLRLQGHPCDPHEARRPERGSADDRAATEADRAWDAGGEAQRFRVELCGWGRGGVGSDGVGHAALLLEDGRTDRKGNSLKFRALCAIRM